ncbi:Kinesin-related protein 6 [Hondaea fermentalgiana]|uniref:Kinesin-like protein n=1 Tax=Hondaea fermentalgiana TaxID=2315210 RepID=A0A2R5GUR9_9STRA|nr:Kinesin-related protein 6 [Hondaea fermentalgiana]|eukprot:GBG34059.1 Kinesin-related protein 6 [Hondaea fermentalgiana]
MGNEDSKLVDEGGGHFDPRKNYDKRTSRKHHRQDFMNAIRAWRTRKEAELGPHETLLPNTNNSSHGAASPPAPDKNRPSRLVRTLSIDSQPPPPPPATSPPSSPIVLRDEDLRILDWFELVCTRDAPRGAALLEHLQKIHRAVARQHAATPKATRTQRTDPPATSASDTSPSARTKPAALRPRKHSDIVTLAASRSLSPRSAANASKAKRLQVFVRKRPMFDKEIDDDFDVVDATGALQPNGVLVFDTRMKADMRGMKMTPHVFTFDRVFDEFASNAQVYRETTIGLVQHALAGKSASAFVFGQTGSGKTYTMSAVLSLAGQTIFHVLSAASRATVSLTMYELYGTQCRDLLGTQDLASRGGHDDEHDVPFESDEPDLTASEAPSPSTIRMLEDGDGSLRFPGLTTQTVHSQEELIDSIERGQRARATCETGVHDRSSRSHAFCQISIHYDDRQGQLMLVDLAGSERNKDSLMHDARLAKEGAEINKSLMALKDCFRAQAEGRDFVPFRASMLTRILKPALTDPLGKTSIIATLSPSSGDTEHTLSTLSNVSVMLADVTQKTHIKLSTETVASQSLIKATKAYNEAKAADPRKWSATKLRAWWLSIAPKHIPPPANIDGAMLSKWSKNRFYQYYAQAVAAADALYSDFRDMIATLRKRHELRVQAKVGKR